MGQTENNKIVIVVILFLLVAVFVYGKPESVHSVKKRSLNEALTEVGGWKAGPHVPLDKVVVEVLALDDYLNRVFFKGDQSVTLYIGYYLTSGKVGAAHDPLVCFPGQGWDVSSQNRGIFKIGEETDLTVSYSTMTVKRSGDHSQIVLYWFQSYEAANANTLFQKITSMVQKFTDAKEDNAFVRLTCSTAEKSEAECMATMKDFTKALYPVFLQYVRD